ncbi:YdcF family protein [Chromobacterium piscinae]|uniref:YdcF family protein n=1 Tax=Chromobacterium piscinae TaxID=686831 RepID=A0ABV0H5X4_9NEIS|nr:YdcF family protein [Chromobacterium piscinae]MBX9295856.1 YdcF family protein [Chromobacterium vaccinii]MBX9346946.1 YdcF family protein [Chromobacterium vaccinii]MBX9356053.1 YdcF family protein [Chromobacterium vaccinii]MCD5327253.1 YdcF family protein [Chromobacterium piscinae]
MLYLRLMIRGFLLAVLLVVLGFAYVAWSIVDYGSGEDVPAADAALVLGAAAWGSKPSPVFRERINHAVKLYQSGKVRWIVFTGGTPEPGYPAEADVGREFAARQGVPMTAMLVENQSRTTWQNLSNARDLGNQFGIRSYLLVSDPLHMRRAVLMAGDLGLRAYPAPTQSSRFRTLASWSRFLARETWLYVGYRVFRQLS